MFASLVLCVLISLCAFAQTPAQAASHSWPPAVQSALERAGANRAGLETALSRVPKAQREGLEFLVENMPDEDLKTVSPALLLDNVAQAYAAFDAAPWKTAVPGDVFLNDVLPYACLDEDREDWRAGLREKAAPLVAGCRTPGEAAQALNAKLFPLVKVRYSTERKKPNQAPSETIGSGVATCSGLSILLADACRSVGIPARVVGTPLWTNMRGNHTWVEVWDNGWHFVGAAEPDPKGLDHAWFEHDASEAKRDVPEHAIYASSFKRTDLYFPLVWAPDSQVVPAVNVTDRYAVAPAPAADTTRLEVRVLDASGKRVAAPVTVRDIVSGASNWTGTSRGETSDLNNFLTFDVPRGRVYEIDVADGDRQVAQPFAPGDSASSLAEIHLEPVHTWKPLSQKDQGQLAKAFADYFAAPAAQQAAWTFPKGLDKLLLRNEPAVRQAAWDAYKAAPIHQDAHDDFVAHQVRFQQYLSPYVLKTVGTRPAHGWALFIAMHGGGGAPKEVNDSQWKIMETHYKEHPEAGGYLYLALRAPNDTWNGFYDVYVYPLIANLVKEFTLYGDVDPNKVFIMGYSHGGYGAFAIGPKEPDLFAAIHASAGAPTDGETVARTLRTTVFTCMVGGLDTAYGRLDRDKKFTSDVAALRGDRHDIYPVAVDIADGVEHPNLNDRDKVAVMYPAVRNPVPREVTWLMTDDVIHDFFWLRTDDPAKTREIDATCRDNTVTVTTTGGGTATALLDSRLVDFDKPVTFVVDGKTTTAKLTPSVKTLAETLLRRGDPDLAFTVEVPLTTTPAVAAK